MIDNTSETPFNELPEALVEELLKNCGKLSTKLSQHFNEIKNNKRKFRELLYNEKLLKNIDDFGIVPIYPTSCGIDGSYITERLVATDISAVAALAIEGLTPPGPEKKFWPRPRHFSHIDVTKG